MSHHGRRDVLIRLVAVAAAATLASIALPSASWADAPQGSTCAGSLTPDSNGASQGEPNLLDYSFSCGVNITNYTFVVNRYPDNPNVIDDFEPSPVEVAASDGTGYGTFTCAGTTPGNGFNCNSPSTPLVAGDSVQGSLDPIDPYCKRLIPGAKPGTPAEPQAQVSVIVQDSTGATDGPFTLDLTPICPSVPDTTPYPTPPKPKPTTKCWGKLAKDSSPTTTEPNLLDYSFLCNGKVTAYSVVVTRQAHRGDNLNAFDTDPLVYLPSGAPSVNESFTCAGVTPSSGFNCAAPSNGAMAGGHTVRGAFNTVDPYCKRLPPGAKPGTPAEPQAVAQLVITDATGAERGPFTFVIKPACPAVPNRVPSSTQGTRHGRRRPRA
jgi:hypothetical protein